MKRLGLGMALAVSPFAFVGFAEAQSDLTAAQCQPLTAENMSMCCAAANWKDIVLAGDIAHCPPLDATDQQSGRLGQPIDSASAAETPDTTGETPDTGGTDTTGSLGNPGNEPGISGPGSEVGKAGEDPGGGTKSSPTEAQGQAN